MMEGQDDVERGSVQRRICTGLSGRALAAEPPGGATTFFSASHGG